MDDWHPGDRALCVKVTHHIIPGRSDRLVVGRLYTVDVVGKPIVDFGGERALGLREVKPSRAGHGFPETLFTKVTPGADITGREVEAKRPVPVSA